MHMLILTITGMVNSKYCTLKYFTWKTNGYNEMLRGVCESPYFLENAKFAESTPRKYGT